MVILAKSAPNLLGEISTLTTDHLVHRLILVI